MITCNYTSGISSAKLRVTVPQQPVFKSPTAGNHVVRATDTNVTYSSADGHSIQIIADNGPSRRVSANNDLEPDNDRYTGLDTSALDAGPGRITLNREYAPQVLAAASFHSASLNILAEATIDVDWV